MRQVALVEGRDMHTRKYGGWDRLQNFDVSLYNREIC